jgi:hypothetical protein
MEGSGRRRCETITRKEGSVLKLLHWDFVPWGRRSRAMRTIAAYTMAQQSIPIQGRPGGISANWLGSGRHTSSHGCAELLSVVKLSAIAADGVPLAGHNALRGGRGEVRRVAGMTSPLTVKDESSQGPLRGSASPARCTGEREVNLRLRCWKASDAATA